MCVASELAFCRDRAVLSRLNDGMIDGMFDGLRDLRCVVNYVAITTIWLADVLSTDSMQLCG